MFQITSLLSNLNLSFWRLKFVNDMQTEVCKNHVCVYIYIYIYIEREREREREREVNRS